MRSPGFPVVTRRVTLPHPDLAVQHQRLGATPRLDQPALHEQLIEPDALDLRLRGRGRTHPPIVAQPASLGLTGIPRTPGPAAAQETLVVVDFQSTTTCRSRPSKVPRPGESTESRRILNQERISSAGPSRCRLQVDDRECNGAALGRGFVRAEQVLAFRVGVLPVQAGGTSGTLPRGRVAHRAGR